jgi:large subunit ribosomal protein L30
MPRKETVAAGEAGKPAPKRRTAKPKAAASGQARLRVKQIRSGIGHAYTYRRTLAALGLRHHQAEIVVPDTPTVRGMLFKVAHLVRVRPAEA